MELKNQVTNKDLSIELRDNGYSQEGLWWWEQFDTKAKLFYKKPIWSDVTIVAPTVAELGEALPPKCRTWRNTNLKTKRWTGGISKSVNLKARPLYVRYAYADTEADCRAKMYLYLKKEKLI